MYGKYPTRRAMSADIYIYIHIHIHTQFIHVLIYVYIYIYIYIYIIPRLGQLFAIPFGLAKACLKLGAANHQETLVSRDENPFSFLVLAGGGGPRGGGGGYGCVCVFFCGGEGPGRGGREGMLVFFVGSVSLLFFVWGGVCSSMWFAGLFVSCFYLGGCSVMWFACLFVLCFYLGGCSVLRCLLFLICRLFFVFICLFVLSVVWFVWLGLRWFRSGFGLIRVFMSSLCMCECMLVVFSGRVRTDVGVWFRVVMMPHAVS